MEGIKLWIEGEMICRQGGGGVNSSACSEREVFYSETAMLSLSVRRGDDLHGQCLSFKTSRDFRFALHILQELTLLALKLVRGLANDQDDLVTVIDGMERPCPSCISLMEGLNALTL